MRSILAVGRNADLLKTRAEVLRRAKAEVTPAYADDALRLLNERRFDLLVLCHTLTPEETDAVVAAARSRDAQVRLLRVAVLDDACHAVRKTTIDDEVLTEPRTLVAKVSEILGT